MRHEVRVTSDSTGALHVFVDGDEVHDIVRVVLSPRRVAFEALQPGGRMYAPKHAELVTTRTYDLNVGPSVEYSAKVVPDGVTDVPEMAVQAVHEFAAWLVSKAGITSFMLATGCHDRVEAGEDMRIMADLANEYARTRGWPAVEAGTS